MCVGHALYSYTISDHSGPPWTLPQAFILAGLIVACVQGFFGLRIYRLFKKLSIPIIIWVMALLRLMASMIIFELPLNPALGYHADTKQELLTTSSWILGVANDLLITATLVFVLRRQRADVHQRTVVLADKIIAWSIETGMITSAVAIAELICFLTMPKTWIWIAISTIEARVFANSFLASLNGRTTLYAIGNAPLTFVIPMSFSNGVEIANRLPFKPLLSVQWYSLASQAGEAEADMALSKRFLCDAEGAFDKDESFVRTFAAKAAAKGLPSGEFAMGYYNE
ncbi:hypothetical protein B0H14DRAFT_3883937, partial [Mycena olivaceomarginata]